jgi:predicted GH43/DUF377 family glycosyl hydrolase
MIMNKPLLADKNLVIHNTRLFSAGDFGEDISGGGVINPGALHAGEDILLLLRCEPAGHSMTGGWNEQRATPVLVRLSSSLEVLASSILTQVLPHCVRGEDWRLFHYNGRIYTNHSLYYYNGNTHHDECSVCISEVDREHKRLSFVCELVYKKHTHEKNWAFFSLANRLFAIHSLKPFKVLEVDMKTGMSSVIINKPMDLGFPIPVDTALYNSTNPVEWDENHFLLFVHARYSSGTMHRLYEQYGVLIDKSTLLPVYSTREPLITGGSEEGKHPGVHYTMAALPRDEGILTFYGEGDSHSGMVLMDRKILQERFYECNALAL